LESFMEALLSVSGRRVFCIRLRRRVRGSDGRPDETGLSRKKDLEERYEKTKYMDAR
jgi:hypothetical protein